MDSKSYDYVTQYDYVILLLLWKNKLEVVVDCFIEL